MYAFGRFKRDEWLFDGEPETLTGTKRGDFFAEQVRQLYQNSRIGLVGTFINCFIIAFIVRNVVESQIIVTWVALTAALSAGRYYLANKFFTISPPKAEVRLWYVLHIISTTLSGILWGLAGIILFPADSVSHQIFIAFVLGGMVAGAVGTYAIIMPAFLSFSIPTALPIALNFFALGDEMHVSMGVMTIIFWLLMFFTAKRLNTVLKTSLKLRFDKTDLIKELAQTNERLKEEIEERETAEAEALKAKERAENASRSKSEFLANMSHELRTPLNHIIGFTEMLVDRSFGELNERQEESLTDVLTSSNHLLSLIDEILDLSKVEAGKMEIERSEVNLRDMLTDSLRLFKEEALKHGIRLNNYTKGIPELCHVDETKVKQILYNLLSNAVKFTPDGGVITLSARALEEPARPENRPGHSTRTTAAEQSTETEGSGTKCVEVSVSDNGIGISSENRDRIFQAFEQADGSASRRFQGTGLGLSLTKRLVELHGGRIRVESEGEGRGSTFSFMIPV